MRSRIGIAAASLFAGIAFATTAPMASPALAQEATIRVIENDPVKTFNWTSEEVELNQGDDALWEFKLPDGTPAQSAHMVTIYDGPDPLTASPIEGGTSGLYSPGNPSSTQDFTFTFDREGEFAFTCSLIHPTQMVGVIRVGEAPRKPTKPRVKLKPIKPKATVKPLRKLSFRATVRNRGDGAAEDVSVCVGVPRKLIHVLRGQCFAIDRLEAGSKRRVSFELRPTRKARGMRVPVAVTTSGSNLATKRTVERIVVARKG